VDYREVGDEEFFKQVGVSWNSALAETPVVSFSLVHLLCTSYCSSPVFIADCGQQMHTPKVEALSRRSSEPVYSTADVHVRLQNILMQLRKVCNHSYLVEYPLTPTVRSLS
jgi:hypothetical protein